MSCHSIVPQTQSMLKSIAESMSHDSLFWNGGGTVWDVQVSQHQHQLTEVAHLLAATVSTSINTIKCVSYDSIGLSRARNALEPRPEHESRPGTGLPIILNRIKEFRGSMRQSEAQARHSPSHSTLKVCLRPHL